MNDETSGGVLSALPTLIRGQGGLEYVNRGKLGQRPLWLGLKNGTLTVAGGGSGSDILLAPRDQSLAGDVEIWKLQAESTDKFSVLLYDQALDVELSNSPVESSLIFGRADLPARLYESIYLPTGKSLKASCYDLSGSSNAIKILAEGVQNLRQRTPQEQARATRKRFVHPYWLTFDTAAEVSLTADGTQTLTMTVPGGVNFEAWGIVARSTGDATLELIEGDQRSLMSPSAQPISLVAGKTAKVAGVNAASLPNMFASTLLLPGTTVIKAKVTDLSSATNKVSIALVGRLLYQKLSG